MELQISTKAPQEENGTITYLKSFPNLLTGALGAGAGALGAGAGALGAGAGALGAGAGDEIKGVFAFSFYASPKNPYEFWQHYIQGIQAYINIVNTEKISIYDKGEIIEKKNPFLGWKVVIYTDQQIYDYLKGDTMRRRSKENAPGFLENPSVEFAIVKWDYYDRDKNGKVNGDVLRAMRFRAFFDFNSVPVFVRDADTLWVTKTSTFETHFNTILEWEINFYEGAKEQKKPYIFGTSLKYKRMWHTNISRKELEAPIAGYAGMQSAFPGTPCFENLTLWEEAVNYILTRSRYVSSRVTKLGINHIFSNDKSIGKDEQILLYVFLPACFDSIFFFELYMGIFQHGNNDENFIKEGGLLNPFTEEEYPKLVFSQTNGAIALEEHIKNKFTPFVKAIEAAAAKAAADAAAAAAAKAAAAAAAAAAKAAADAAAKKTAGGKRTRKQKQKHKQQRKRATRRV